jgi:hypothetical protein
LNPPILNRFLLYRHVHVSNHRRLPDKMSRIVRYGTCRHLLFFKPRFFNPRPHAAHDRSHRDAGGGRPHPYWRSRNHHLLRLVTFRAVDRSRLERDYSGVDSASGVARPIVGRVSAAIQARPGSIHRRRARADVYQCFATGRISIAPPRRAARICAAKLIAEGCSGK